MRSLVFACMVVLGCDSPETTSGNSDVEVSIDTSPETSGGNDSNQDTSSSACLSGHACERDDDCPDGHRCNTALDAPMCQQIHCGALDSACSDSALCAGGMRCSSALQRCASGEAGSPCGFAGDCQEGLRCPFRSAVGDDPIVMTPEGAAVMWWTTALPCISITYEPALEPHRGTLVNALASAVDASCTELCFTEPTPSSENLSERRIHFAAMREGLFEQQRNYDPQSGEMINAVAVVPVADGYVPVVSDFVDGISWSIALDFGDREPRDAICDWYPIMRCR